MCIGCWSKEKLPNGDPCTLVLPNHMFLTWTQTVVTNSPGEEEEEQYKLLYEGLVKYLVVLFTRTHNVLVELRQHTKYYPTALEVFPIETYGELQCNNNMGSYLYNIVLYMFTHVLQANMCFLHVQTRHVHILHRYICQVSLKDKYFNFY